MRVQIIIVPYDTARRDWRSGAGPEHLLRAGLAAHLRDRGHSIAEIEVIEADPSRPPAEIATGFELMRKVAVAVRAAREAGWFPLVLSGNCNASVGALSGLTPSRRALFWFDAHGDLNTPDTTASGFLDGTGLATALGLCWTRLASLIPGFQPVAPEATFLLGARDLDPPEEALLAREAVTAISAERMAIELPELLSRAPLDGAIGHVHLDLDALDPEGVGRANTLPVADGLSVEQLTGAVAAIRSRVPLQAATLASYAPEFDTDGGVCRAALAAVDAMLSEPLDAHPPGMLVP
jgi:arginase